MGQGLSPKPPTGGSLHCSHFCPPLGFHTSLLCPFTLYVHIILESKTCFPLPFGILPSLKVPFKCHFVPESA